MMVLLTKDRNVVIQETRDTPTLSTTTKEAMGAKSPLEEEQRSRKRKISALPSMKASKMYLILPSFAEQYKADIKMIIAREKSNSAALLSSKKMITLNFKLL